MSFIVTAEMNPTGLGVALVDIHGNVCEVLKPASPESAGPSKPSDAERLVIFAMFGRRL